MKLPAFLRCLFLFLAGLISFQTYGQTALIRQEQRSLPLLRDSIVYVNSLNRIGMLFHMKNPDSCFGYGFKAKAMASRIQYPKGMADADNNIAISLSLRGLYSQSLALFSKLLPVYTKMGDTANVVQMMMNISSVYAALSDKAKANAFCRKAITTGKNISQDSIMGLVYANYLEINPDLPDDSVVYYLNKSHQIALRYKDQRMLIAIPQLKAAWLISKGHKEEALPIIMQSMAAAKDAGLESEQISSLDLFAKYYANQPDSAFTYYTRLYKLVEAKEYTYLKVSVLKNLFHYSGLAGDKDKQISISRLLTTALSEENESIKKFIGDYVQYSNIQNDNNLLLRRNQISEKKIGLLLLICILVSFFIIIIYRLYQLSRKHEREQKQLNTQINTQNKSLQQADEFKNKLISILAHDFRTPLISTIAIAGMMKENQDFSKEEMEKFYGAIEKDAQAMLQSFDTILQWIKQQLSGYQYKAESLPMHDLVQEAAAIYNHLLASKGIILENQVMKSISIFSDREMLQFVNRNLLSNAIKHSPAGGHIAIKAEKTDQELIISVEDQGPGMNQDTIDHLFSVSGRFGNSTEHGAGIALSMCRDFLQKLGGRIWAENKTDRGAVFFYAIPLRAA